MRNFVTCPPCWKWMQRTGPAIKTKNREVQITTSLYLYIENSCLLTFREAECFILEILEFRWHCLIIHERFVGVVGILCYNDETHMQTCMEIITLNLKYTLGLTYD